LGSDFFDLAIGFYFVTLVGSGFTKPVGEVVRGDFGAREERDREGIVTGEIDGREGIEIGETINLGRELEFKVVFVQFENETGAGSSRNDESKSVGLEIYLTTVQENCRNDGSKTKVETTTQFLVLDTDREKSFGRGKRRDGEGISFVADCRGRNV